jgi:tetratricopeptide (TPR) repeat protein
MEQLLRRPLAATVCTVLLASSQPLAAQARTYFDGLSEVTTAVTGTYGDEGAHIGPALDTMAVGLAQWDRDLQAFEAQVGSSRDDTPGEVALRTELARRYAQRGRLDDALRELGAVLTLDPRAFPAHLLRGQVLDAISRLKEAGEAFRTAWAGDRRDAIAAYFLLRHAATLDPQDVRGAQDTLLAAYRALLDAGAHEASPPFPRIDVLPHTAGQMQGIAPALYRHAYACIARGEYAEAIVEFRKAAASDPLVVDPFARSSSVGRAIAALREGRTADARSLLERSGAVADSSEAHRVRGLIDWAAADDAQSIEQLGIAIQKNPRDERSRLALSRVLSSAGRTSDAERVLLETLRVLPESALARVWLGSGYEEAHRFAEARQAFEDAAVSVTTGRDALLDSIARLASASGDLPAAIDAWTQSVTASPNDRDVHKRLARALLQQDRGDEAFRELVAALLIDPTDAGAHLGVGRILLSAGRNEDAAAALGRAVRLSPDYTEARYALATALSRLGRTREAAQEFDRVEQAQRQEIADRRRTLALATLKEEAALRTAEGNNDRAVTLWQQVIEQEPDRSSNHLNLATALARVNQTNMAIEQFEIAIKLGADPALYRWLADLYAKAGRTDEAAHARALYTQALHRTASVEERAP